MNEKYHEALDELIRAIKRFTWESNERMLENEKAIEVLANQVSILTQLNIAILEEQKKD